MEIDDCGVEILYEGFRAGVEPGGLTTDYEIKILICHVLKHIERPMPVSALIELFVGEGSATILRRRARRPRSSRAGTLPSAAARGKSATT